MSTIRDKKDKESGDFDSLTLEDRDGLTFNRDYFQYKQRRANIIRRGRLKEKFNFDNILEPIRQS